MIKISTSSVFSGAVATALISRFAYELKQSVVLSLFGKIDHFQLQRLS